MTVDVVAVSPESLGDDVDATAEPLYTGALRVLVGQIFRDARCMNRYAVRLKRPRGTVTHVVALPCLCQADIVACGFFALFNESELQRFPDRGALASELAALGRRTVRGKAKIGLPETGALAEFLGRVGDLDALRSFVGPLVCIRSEALHRGQL
jgi:hypothetical protein